MLRILLPTLALVLAAGAYWLFRSPEPSSPEAATRPPASEGPRGGDPTSPGGTRAVGAGGNDPALPSPLRMRSTSPTTEGLVAPVAASGSLEMAYQAEPRDPVLATAHSEQVREIVEALAESGTGTAHIEELDCRTQHCKLQLASDDSAGLVKLVDALQDERGFLGKAESIMLSRDQDDMIFYLRFAPPK